MVFVCLNRTPSPLEIADWTAVSSSDRLPAGCVHKRLRIKHEWRLAPNRVSFPDEGQFDVVSVASSALLSRLTQNDHLSDADVAVLAHADAHDGVAVMDETYGRDVAAVEGITTRGSAYLVLTLAKQGAISAADARTVIDSMIEVGWYCAPDVYVKIVQTLDAVSE